MGICGSSIPNLKLREAYFRPLDTSIPARPTLAPVAPIFPFEDMAVKKSQPDLRCFIFLLSNS
jgi:hypothetical protein